MILAFILGLGLWHADWLPPALRGSVPQAAAQPPATELISKRGQLRVPGADTTITKCSARAVAELSLEICPEISRSCQADSGSPPA